MGERSKIQGVKADLAPAIRHQVNDELMDTLPIRSDCSMRRESSYDAKMIGFYRTRAQDFCILEHYRCDLNSVSLRSDAGMVQS